jgi:hypothetical protein
MKQTRILYRRTAMGWQIRESQREVPISQERQRELAEFYRFIAQREQQRRG